MKGYRANVLRQMPVAWICPAYVVACVPASSAGVAVVPAWNVIHVVHIVGGDCHDVTWETLGIACAKEVTFVLTLSSWGGM